MDEFIIFILDPRVNILSQSIILLASSVIHSIWALIDFRDAIIFVDIEIELPIYIELLDLIESFIVDLQVFVSSLF